MGRLIRFRTLGIAALLTTSLMQTGGAVVRPKGAEAPVVAAERGGRTMRDVVWSRGDRDGRLAAAGLAGWTAQWDRDTDVPLRMWGAGIVFSGSTANPAIAEAAARQFLAQHLAVLAPGASPADFVLVSNQLSPNGKVRSVGFEQRSNGVRVHGGAIGFAFQADRLAMASSTALPNVAVAMPHDRLATTATRSSAVRWLGQDGFVVAPRAGLEPKQVIYPTIRAKRAGKLNIEYRLAEELELDAANNEIGMWTVWVDAVTGEPIARKTGIKYASGRVLFDVPDRHPAGTRQPQPAPFARYTIAGETVTSTADGTISWTGTGGINVDLTPIGQFASIVNRGGAPRITETVGLTANGQFTWSKAVTEFEDAQVSSYVFINQVKAFTKARLNPGLTWLDRSITLNVNENSTCNAMSGGNTLHFFRRGGGCENTARLADVVYHEFGHSLHGESIISGIGNFDGALSEGIGDVLALAMTNDPGMGRGFFMDDRPLRQLNPANGEKVWGVNTTGEVHNDGEVYGGTMYDLKTALEASLGTEAGYDHWLEIFYATIQRGADIPSTYAEALLADDDDGNLDNGTPNQCVIDAAFASHGLADLSVMLGLRGAVRDGNHVVLPPAMPANAACEVPSVVSAQIEWRRRGELVPQLIDMASGTEGLTADLPTIGDGNVAEYRISVRLSNNTTVKFPNNEADPFYQYMVGAVEPIKCFDFEDGMQGWTGTADWEAAEPEGLSNDPSEAHGGTKALGIDLSTDGAYRDRSTQTVESPEIDLGGATKVRLQYYRHLAVEDGVFDQAKVSVNGTEVFKNFVSADENGGVNHVDKEWIFQDVDLSPFEASGKVKIKFDLTSDQGLALGGWTVDDVCVVRIVETPLPGTEDDGGGCCSSSGAPAGSLLLGLATMGLVIRRRRRT